MSNIYILSETQRIIIDSATSVATIVRGGPVGPPGPPGQGGQAISYEHTQAVAASSWVITHNLGYKPNVTAEDDVSGDEIMCSIIYHNDNQIELQFNQSRAGKAYLS